VISLQRHETQFYVFGLYPIFALGLVYWLKKKVKWIKSQLVGVPENKDLLEEMI